MEEQLRVAYLERELDESKRLNAEFYSSVNGARDMSEIQIKLLFKRLQEIGMVENEVMISSNMRSSASRRRNSCEGRYGDRDGRGRDDERAVTPQLALKEGTDNTDLAVTRGRKAQRLESVRVGER